MTETAPAERRNTAVLLALCAFAYLYVFPYQAKLNNPNENVRLYMTAALAEYGSYEIDQLRQRWGWVNDAATYDGHIYSVKAPGTSLLGVPGYFSYLHLSRWFGHPFDRMEALWVCRITASALPALVFAFCFARFLQRRGYTAGLRHAALISVLLGSLCYGYALLFVSHTASAVTAFGAFLLLYEVRQGQRSATPLVAAGAGLLSALVTWFEYPGLVCTLVLTVYAGFALRSLKLWAAFCLAGLPPALSMMHFHWSAFDNPFTPGHRFVENDAFRAAHEQGFYGAIAPNASALYGLLIDPGAGLFPLTPLLLFALPGLWLMCKQREQRADGIACAAVFGLTTLAISAMNNWRGGWTIGPRYLALCVPFLAFAALPALERVYARAPRTAAGLALGASAVGLLASGVPSAYYPHLPPEVTRPLPQLFSVLIAHGFAPLNLGTALGVHGTASMLPLALAGIACLSLCWLALPRPQRAGALAIACASCCVLALPVLVRPSHEPGVREAVAFITRRFYPPGHDAAARLATQLKAAGPGAQPEDRARLRELYLAEGREKEARAQQ